MQHFTKHASQRTAHAVKNHTTAGREAVFRRTGMLIACGLLCAQLSGCQVIGAVVVGAASVVGLAGYAVYKTGEAVVTGVSKAGSAVAAGTTAAVSVIFFNGDFKTSYQGDVQTVWTSARQAFYKALFVEIKGSFDALSGELTAKTREGTDVRLKLKSINPQSTEASIRVGVTGDMKTSETIHGLILQELSALSPPQDISSSAHKVTP
jgi:hypothetical protein